MDQQFEEMNNKLNSVTDPTGFLRMVRRNNLVNRCVLRLTASGSWGCRPWIRGSECDAFTAPCSSGPRWHLRVE